MTVFRSTAWKSLTVEALKHRPVPAALWECGGWLAVHAAIQAVAAKSAASRFMTFNPFRIRNAELACSFRWDRF